MEPGPGSTARGDSFESYACEVNSLSIDELFRRYERSGFLYPAKLRKLAPFLPLVKENWRKARRGGELLQWVATFDNPALNQWASITSWLSTRTGWVSQHLVSMGGPAAARTVMLAGQAVRIAGQRDGSHQSWFRRSNRYANRLFGSIPETIGGQRGWAGDYAHYYLPARLSAHASDLRLDAVDQIYARVGLRRYRRVLAVRAARDSALLGVVPLVIDARLSGALQALGAEYVRDYAQCAWLQSGFVDCYRRTERFYAPLTQAGNRRGLARPPALRMSSTA
jgi:hypothetical protein